MMKKLILCSLMFLMVSMAWAQDGGDAAKIVFLDATHDFGDIKQGDQVEWVFKFENKGSAPLVLTNVATTCGCTAPNGPASLSCPAKAAKSKSASTAQAKLACRTK